MSGTTQQRKRVVLLGIDAAEHTLVQSMIERGKLPALRELLRQGVSGQLDSPADLYSGAVWPTFYSGQRPAWHGIYHNKLWQPERMCCIVPDAGTYSDATVLGTIRLPRHSQLRRRRSTGARPAADIRRRLLERLGYARYSSNAIVASATRTAAPSQVRRSSDASGKLRRPDLSLA